MRGADSGVWRGLASKAECRTSPMLEDHEKRLRSSRLRTMRNQRNEGIGMHVDVISPPTAFDNEAAPSARRAVLSQSCTPASTRHVVRPFTLCSWRFISFLVCLAAGASHCSWTCQTVLDMSCPQYRPVGRPCRSYSMLERLHGSNGAVVSPSSTVYQSARVCVIKVGIEEIKKRRITNQYSGKITLVAQR